MKNSKTRAESTDAESCLNMLRDASFLLHELDKPNDIIATALRDLPLPKPEITKRLFFAEQDDA